MDKDNVFNLLPQARVLNPLTDMLQRGAHQLISRAVETEREELLEQCRDQHTGDGKAAVVRNG